MLDVKLLRTDTKNVAKALKKRGYQLDIAQVQALEEERKALQVKTQELQNQRNQFSKQIGQAKAQGQPVQPLLDQVGTLGGQLQVKQDELVELQKKIDDIYSSIPNIPHESVPEGDKPEQCVEIRRWGQPKDFDFEVKDHVDLGVSLHGMDFNAAAKLTGSRFVVLKGAVAKLHRALIQFMLDIQIDEHGYEEISVPYMVNRDSLFGTGQLPKFLDDLFSTNHHHDYCLIPTAEVPLTNLARDEILSEEQLPKRLVAHTPCFRSEAGSYGKDTRGMIRLHQFEKVELVWLTKPEDSYHVLETLTEHAESILQRLQLPYRVVSLCGGDLGFSSAKTYDLEVWLPAQNCYREISSCSNCTDFQTRRMQARYRDNSTGKPQLLHSLNGSGLPVGRTLVAILENFQDENGRIHLPEKLVPYMGGVEVLSA